VNTWNDAYSPQKTLKSPGKKLQPAGSFDTPPLSPTKRNKTDIAERKAFEASKETFASAFLAELDSTVTNNQISALAATTGGVQLIWSKTLTTTAGRANWKRETIKTRTRPSSDKTTGQDGTVTTVTHKHHASIELSTKIIDNSDRLLNVVAHEFCHLANFMVSNITDQPHGKSFKNWGRLVSKAFADRGVEVTTNHSYAIEYKYIWKCEEVDGGCGREFGRHSKSVDPARHRCGGCKGSLVQIKPIPRKNAATGKGSGYAGYVKKHFAEVKKSLGPGVKHGEVMKALSQKYRAEKDESVEGILKGLEGVKLGDLRSPIEIE
jgi:predicted SprT family Zn-dependent metalloprotease